MASKPEMVLISKGHYVVGTIPEPIVEEAPEEAEESKKTAQIVEESDPSDTIC